MGGLLGGGKVDTPKPPPPPPPPPTPANPPTIANPSVTASGTQAASRARAAAGEGMGGTLVTGGKGLVTPPATAPVSLLGGGG